MAGYNVPRWLIWASAPVVAAVLLVALWSWGWLIPAAERSLSATLGRSVTIGRMQVAIGWTIRITGHDMTIGNPEGFAADPPFARAERMIVRIDAMASLRRFDVVIREVELLKPHIEAFALADGRDNYSFVVAPPAGETGPIVQPLLSGRVGLLRVLEGTAHVVDPRWAADFQLQVVTREEGTPTPSIVVRIDGTYAGEAITGGAIGGALLALQDTQRPWPLQLSLASGANRISLHGTLRNPLELEGADLTLELSGPDMALLEPLTGVPIPGTPNYQVAGRLDYTAERFRFHEIVGRVGQTDLGGTLSVGTTGAKPDVVGELHSRRVDLADLGGFIGEEPGRTTTPGQTPEQRRETARNEAAARMLPDAPISLPKLNAADFRISYRADSVIGRNTPFDNLRVEMAIKDGVVTLQPMTLGVGRGQIAGTLVLTPADENQLSANADVQFQRLDLSRLMRVTAFEGAGTVNGRARLVGTGNSMAAILGQGDGAVTMAMSGGNLSALLVDLSGLRLANALLSSLGVPGRTPVQCFVGDFALVRGTLNLRTLILDTEDVLIGATGTVDLARERLNIRLRSESKGFTVGALPTSILVGGTFRNPSVAPELGEVLARGGIAGGLAALVAPLAAVLPTIQFGIGEDNRCEALVRRGAGATATPR